MQLDTDEIIVPMVNKDYPSMIKSLEEDPLALAADTWHFPSYYFYNVKLMETDIPSNMNMLSRIFYQKDVTTVKSIMKTDDVLTFDIHKTSHCLASDGCNYFRVNSTFGRTHHYRKSCPPNAGSICNRIVKVKSMVIIRNLG